MGESVRLSFPFLPSPLLSIPFLSPALTTTSSPSLHTPTAHRSTENQDLIDITVSVSIDSDSRIKQWGERFDVCLSLFPPSPTSTDLLPPLSPSSGLRDARVGKADGDAGDAQDPPVLRQVPAAAARLSHSCDQPRPVLRPSYRRQLDRIVFSLVLDLVQPSSRRERGFSVGSPLPCRPSLLREFRGRRRCLAAWTRLKRDGLSFISRQTRERTQVNSRLARSDERKSTGASFATSAALGTASARKDSDGVSTKMKLAGTDPSKQSWVCSVEERLVGVPLGS